MTFDLSSWSARWRGPLDELLGARVAPTWPPAFSEPLAYPLFTGGKRIRPALAVAAWEAVVDDPSDPAPVLPAAAAVELVHTYSLVHDDLPAMDDDDERRGRPTLHVATDEATAILVGDALLTEAFAVLARGPWSDAVRVELIGALSIAAGHRGMVGGQVADIGLPVADVSTLLDVHRLKTGALIAWSVEAGAVVAGAPAGWRSALAEYGAAVGIAFQLADDWLDRDEDAAPGGPPSFVRLLGPDETLRRARQLSDEAVQVVAGLPRPDALTALARYAVERDR